MITERSEAMVFAERDEVLKTVSRHPEIERQQLTMVQVPSRTPFIA